MVDDQSLVLVEDSCILVEAPFFVLIGPLPVEEDHSLVLVEDFSCILVVNASSVPVEDATCVVVEDQNELFFDARLLDSCDCGSDEVFVFSELDTC